MRERRGRIEKSERESKREERERIEKSERESEREERERIEKSERETGERGSYSDTQMQADG